MKKVIAYLFVLLFLYGCVTPKYNYIPQDDKIKKGIYIEKDATYSHLFGSYVIEKGYYRLIGNDDTFAFYLPSKTKNSGNLIVLGMLDPLTSLARNKENNNIYVITKYNMPIEISNVKFKFTNIE